VLRSDRPFAKALIGNPDIADVLPLSDQSIYVLGKKMGRPASPSTTATC
jgi:pilus assembly protein CpaC